MLPQPSVLLSPGAAAILGSRAGAPQPGMGAAEGFGAQCSVHGRDQRLEPQVSADDDFQVCVTWRSRGNVHGSCKDLLPDCRTCAMTNFQLEGGKLRGLFREAVGQHNYFYME